VADSGSKSKKLAQLTQGLRAGEGILIFFALLGGAIVASGQSDYFRPRGGWVLLGLSAIVLVIEMRHWVKIVPAIFIYQMLVVLGSLLSGHATNYSLSRRELILLALLYGAIAVVSATIALRQQNRLDRVALLAFVGLFLWGFVAISSVGTGKGLARMSAGLGSLLVAWGYDRLQRRRGHSQSVQRSE
jgi:hypothetical protein